MLRHLHIALIVLACTFVSQPVHACIMLAPLELEDIRYADVVVIGRIVDYKIILASEFRKQKLADPDLSPEGRKLYEIQSFIDDYARFEVQVQEVLKGKKELKLITATWSNFSFRAPEEWFTGPFLIALRDPHSKIPPLRGPSATIMPNKEPDTLTVLEAPCAPAFMFPYTYDNEYVASVIDNIRQILREDDNAGASKDNNP
ncbi:MAG: hypothetical protein FWG81_03600 [Betaproteobacteria bacterium]|nr:hypothetical protein [Betaproteobacteria bacterium]